MKGELTQTLVQRLCAGDEREGYAALKELLERSRTGREVYSYWEELAALLGSANSYRRTRGARLSVSRVSSASVIPRSRRVLRNVSK